MKTKKVIFVVTTLFMMFLNFLNAQDLTTAQVKIQTSALCETCKKTIEQGLAFEKGVKMSDLDLKTKIVTVTYNPKKTNPEKIKQAISNIGYDADEIKANPKAYNKLEKCCKKEEAPH